ncbi:MAG: hypothetical protein EON56_01470 [Alphaproteobacteria bacterium]|nr:MAG: hypothetical protein EON56_01470 [Alphaproteobacteria bacterium]
MRPVLNVIKELGAVQTARLSEAAEQNRLQAEKLLAALQPLDLLPDRLEASTKLLAGLPEQLEIQLRPLSLIPEQIAASTEPLTQMSENIERTLASIEITVSGMDDAVTKLDLVANDIGLNVGELRSQIEALKQPLSRHGSTASVLPGGTPSPTPLLDNIIDVAEGTVPTSNAPVIDGVAVEATPVAAIADTEAGIVREPKKSSWLPWRE